MTFDKKKYDQKYAKDNFDRIPIVVKKGEKDKIAEFAKKRGFKSLSDYIKNLIYLDMNDTNKNKNINIKNVTKQGGQNIINIE